MTDPTSWQQFGLAGLIMGATFSIVQQALALALRSITGRDEGSDRGVQCAFDELAREKLAHLDSSRQNGEMACAWRGRDEVRDLLELIRQQNATLVRLVDTIEEERR